jgi:hypothetical protein
MAESKTETPGGVKYIIWGVLGVIAILVTVKQLGFTPTKITTPGVSVELKESGGIAPKAAADGAPAPAENTAELAAKVKELEAQLKAGTLPERSAPVEAATTSGRPVPVNANPTAETAPTVNVAGTWRGPWFVNIKQNGSVIVMQMVDGYGNTLSYGNGTVNGHNLAVRYTNNRLVPGTLTATISPDGREMDITDYGGPTPNYLVFTR